MDIKISKILDEQLTAYLHNNNINTLGQPLPVANTLAENVFEFGKDFAFDYEIGIAPAFDIALSSHDRFVTYQIAIDEQTLAEKTATLQRSFASYEEPSSSEISDILFIDIQQTDPQGNIVPDGIQATGPIRLADIKDEPIQKSLLGLGRGDKRPIDIVKALDNEAHLLRLFKADHNEQLVPIKEASFTITITNIKRPILAPINQALFDKVYGEGKVQSEEEFFELVKAELHKMMIENEKFRLEEAIKAYFFKKIHFDLPHDFLKRWLLYTNRSDKKINADAIEKGYDQFTELLKWQLIEDKIIKENDIKITQQDLINMAEQHVKALLGMHGYANMPDQFIQQYAKEFLDKKENINQVFDNAKAVKVFDYLRATVTLENKQINSTEFAKLTQ